MKKTEKGLNNIDLKEVIKTRILDLKFGLVRLETNMIEGHPEYDVNNLYVIMTVNVFGLHFKIHKHVKDIFNTFIKIEYPYDKMELLKEEERKKLDEYINKRVRTHITLHHRRILKHTFNLLETGVK